MTDNPQEHPTVHVAASEEQREARKALLELFRRSPLPDEELLVNLALYMRSSVLAKLLYVDELYRHILAVPGVIAEFGVWWGQNLALFESLRGIYEPYNRTRKILGFDTFSGYQSITEVDSASELATPGAYGVSEGYDAYLAELLDYHERENTLSHIKKYELVKGDATTSVPTYFAEHPESLVALAYFDMQLYEPTKAALETVLPHMVRGSVIAFDELGSSDFPGETIAAREVVGLTQYRIRRSRYLPDRSFLILE